MLTVFIVGSVICGYLAVAMAVYVVLLIVTDWWPEECQSWALIWPIALPALLVAAITRAVRWIIERTVGWVFREIEKQIRGN